MRAMNMTLRPARFVLLLAAALGCATTRVDVDVYKGPLADHEDVQTEQMAAMAIGAKPLLVQLRDQLEWGEDFVCQRKCHEAWWQPAYVERKANEHSWFDDDQADRVNDILGLYENRTEPVLAGLVSRVRKALADYTAAYNTFRPADMSRCREVSSRLVPGTVDAAQLDEVFGLKRDGAKLAAALDPLLRGYKEFLSESTRDAKRLLADWAAVRDVLSANGNGAQQPLADVLKDPLLQSIREKKDCSSNAAFRALADTKLVEVHARLLHPDNAGDRESFTVGVRQIARAFLDARAALEDAWTGCMELLIEIASRSDAADPEERARLLAARNSLARFAVDLLQPEYLARFLEAADFPGESGIAIQRSGLRQLDAQIDALPSRAATGRDFPHEEVRRMLFERLREQPAEMASSLLELHTLSKQKAVTLAPWLSETYPAQPDAAGEPRRLSWHYPRGWDFGVVRGPTQPPKGYFGKDPFAKDRAIGAHGNAAVAELSGPLARGRLPLGLETLIENYLNAAYDALCDDTEFVKCERERLLKALVRFAEKLLIIANNDGILSMDQGRPCTYRSSHNRGRLCSSGAFGGDDLNRYVLVLQAVGNVIKVQADELCQRGTHGDELENATDREIRALKLAASPEPLDVLARLVSELAYKRDEADIKKGQLAEAIKKKQKELDAVKAAVTPPAPPAAPPATPPPAPTATPPAATTATPASGGAPTDVERLTEELAELKHDQKSATGDAGRWNKIMEAVEDAKPLVTHWIREQAERPTGAAVHAQMDEALADRKRDQTDDAKKVPYSNALSEVAKLLPPRSFDYAASSGVRHAKDVMDELAALLRHEHVLAIRQYGETSATAKNIAAALKAAYDHRAGMVYIRPAMAYLRSSYPSTSLQDDPRLGWDNMLGAHALRNLPLVGESIENCGRRNTARIVAEIDKQFWHNINSVRVSGAGNTNYVIAKDDIGNWYVKNYSADPEPIIKGAQSLAMFSLGAEMNIDLLSRLRAEPGTEGAGTDLDTARNAFEKVLHRYAREYIERTDEDARKLVDLLKDADDSDTPYWCGLMSDISEAWGTQEVAPATGTLKTKLDDALQAAGERHLKPAVEALSEGLIEPGDAEAAIGQILKSLYGGPNIDVKPALELLRKNLRNPVRNAMIFGFIEKKLDFDGHDRLRKLFGELKGHLGAPDQGNRIIDALHAMRRLHTDLITSIAMMSFDVHDQDAGLESKTKARQAVTKTVGARLQEFLEKRTAAVKEYEDGVTFIGEMTSQ